MDQQLRRYVPLMIWMLAVITLVLISLKIVGYGYLPAGDARRHAAKAFTDRPYTEIVVMRPEYSMDHSPGWERMLGFVQRATGWNIDGLMSFSIASLLLCVLCAPLPWLRRPEAWLAALMAQLVAVPDLMTRFTQARPYLISEAILIGVLISWTKRGNRTPSRLSIVMTCLAMGASVWIHGAWYLWVLPLAAFYLARWWRPAFWLTACWIIGCVTGALLTGRPVEFLKQAILIIQSISREHLPQWMLVGEFGPHYGEFATLMVVAVVFLWRQRQSPTSPSLTCEPLLWMMAIGWILGFKADRSWADWGIPAVLVWLTLQFEETVVNAWAATSLRRLAVCALVAAPLFLHATNDLDRRYTRSLDGAFLDGNDPSLKGWMPEGRGIFYTAHLGFFYSAFFKNPRAEWRYVLGFEPALMRDDDLKIYREIQRNNGALAAYEPWIRKMRAEDRLAIYGSTKPDLPALEWHSAAGGLWIGRLPR